LTPDLKARMVGTPRVGGVLQLSSMRNFKQQLQDKEKDLKGSYRAICGA
jgi:hypothetical protein